MNKYIGKATLFIDLDGSCIYQPDVPEGFDLNAEALPHAVELVNKWHDEGHYIYFTTARDESVWTETRDQLNRLGFKYTKLICGISNGKRWVINNAKRSTADTAGAIVVGKNVGLAELQELDLNARINKG